MTDQSRSRTALRWVAHVALPLVVGSGVYFFFRPAPPLARALRGLLGLSRVAPLAHSSAITRFCINQLPDAVWAYAFTASAWLIWEKGPRHRGAQLGWTLFAAALASGWELGQLPHLVPGTFSVADLVSSLVASLLAVLVLRFVSERDTLPVNSFAPETLEESS